MKKYTVLLLYPDYLANQYGEETYLSWTESKGPEQAISLAQAEAFEESEYDPQSGDPSDFAVLICIEGHHGDLTPR